MSVNTETTPAQGNTTVLENTAGDSVYTSLFKKINLTPASRLGDINDFLDDSALAEASTSERLTAAMQVFLNCIRQSGQNVDKLDKTLIDHHIAELDYQISRQLDAVMHHDEFQKVESLWRGLKQLVDNTDYRQNVKTEILDVSKDDLRQDFDDAPELIQSGLYWHTYTAEYDTPGGEPIGAIISAYEFDAGPQDITLLRNISKVSAAAHMPFIGSAGPKFFLKESMEDVAAIKDIGNYFDRAEYIKWKSFRDTDDARYIGLVMPRVLGRLPYGPDNLHDIRLRQEADLWLSVRSDIPAWQIAEKFPALCQAGSPDEVSEIYGAALKGIPLIPVSRVPAALPVRMENQYFALDMESPAAHEMQEQGVCMFYVPELLGALELELFAVLRS